MTLEELSLIVNIILTCITAAMAYATYKMANTTKKSVEEMKLTREEANSAEVIMYFRIEGPRMYIVIENSGNTIATNVKIEPNPELINSKDFNYERLNKIPFLAPNYKIKSFFDKINNYKNNEYPKGEFHISFQNIYGKTIKRTYYYDLKYLNGFGYLLSETDTVEISLNKINKEIIKMNSKLNEINKNMKKN